MIPPIALQMCDVGKSGIDYLLDFQFVKAITCTYASKTGLLVLGMLVYGPIMMAIYSTTDDIRIPAVLTLLTGGAVLSQVAAPAFTIVTVMLLVVGAGVVTVLYWRYSR